jgi:UDP-N-acetyl-2-amino-2-deoxyglucuronate dehydrogenase
VYAKVAYGFRRALAVEDEATAIVDYGQGATGVFTTATHDFVSTDRFEILGDSGKIVVENSATGTVTRLKRPERELSEAMDQQDISKLLSGHLDLSQYYSSETIESEAQWGVQHAGMLKNFAANILDGTPLIAPGAEGMNSVRLANAIHLSSWKRREVPFDFDDDDYLAELNKRIREEGLSRSGHSQLLSVSNPTLLFVPCRSFDSLRPQESCVSAATKWVFGRSTPRCLPPGDARLYAATLGTAD